MRRWIARAILGCAASCAFLVSASAQDATRARLITIPDAVALSDAFPPVPLARGVSGRVVLSCAIAVDGESECAAAEETPADMGFGAAAVALARDWRFEPRREGGVVVASTSRVPIEFQNPNAAALVIEGTLPVDGVRGVNPAEAPINRWSDEVTDIAVCRWLMRTDCRIFRGGLIHSYQRYYPTSAYEAGIEGRALVACAVRSDRSTDCALEGETSGNAELRESALRLVSDIIAARHEQLEPGFVVRVPVDYRMSDRRDRDAHSIWGERPTGSTFNRYFPRRALYDNVQGSVDLICEIQVTRRVTCVVGLERPAGYEFGEAAVRVSQSFLLMEEALGWPGLAVGDRIRIPITFLLG